MEGSKVQLFVFFTVYSLTQQMNVFVGKAQTIIHVGTIPKYKPNNACCPGTRADNFVRI